MDWSHCTNLLGKIWWTLHGRILQNPSGDKFPLCQSPPVCIIIHNSNMFWAKLQGVWQSHTLVPTCAHRYKPLQALCLSWSLMPPQILVESPPRFRLIKKKKERKKKKKKFNTSFLDGCVNSYQEWKYMFGIQRNVSNTESCCQMALPLASVSANLQQRS